MTENIIIIACNSVCPLLMIIISIAMMFRPGQFRSGIGYHTSMSQKSESTWYEAQAFFSKVTLFSNIPTLVISAALTAILEFRGLSDKDEIAMIIMVCTIQVVVLMCDIIATEKHLHDNFDKDGNPK